MAAAAMAAAAKASTAKRHTLMLIQTTERPSSRTYQDYETLGAACNGVIKMYETKLKELNPSLVDITYDVTHLFTYIDSLVDLSCLWYNPRVMMYEPMGKESIKKAVFAHLKSQATA